VPTFQTIPQQQSQFNYQPQPNQQQYQLTPQLGLPVPQIFSNVQATPFPEPTRGTFQQQQPQQQQPPQFQHQFVNAPSSVQPQAQPADQEYKQKLIQKHEQFVAKQYEKSQNKVRQQHEEFLLKQHQIKQHILPTIVTQHNGNYQNSPYIAAPARKENLR